MYLKGEGPAVGALKRRSAENIALHVPHGPHGSLLPARPDERGKGSGHSAGSVVPLCVRGVAVGPVGEIRVSDQGHAPCDLSSVPGDSPIERPAVAGRTPEPRAIINNCGTNLSQLNEAANFS